MGLFWRDRAEAGKALGARLSRLALRDPLVLGLTRGGVPVAAPVAAALRAPLDALVVRKVGAPSNPEFALGAVGEGDASYLDLGSLRVARLDEAWFERAARPERAELRRRLTVIRESVPALDVAGREAVIVDDGVATGATAAAACAVVRARGAARVTFAAPVGSREAKALLTKAADQIVFLETPPDFAAVGQWYEHFDAVSDEEMLACLKGARAGA